MTVVDPKKIARAIIATEPISGTPAPTTVVTEPSASASARARSRPESMASTPARATETTESNLGAPARAKPPAKPTEDTPARADYLTAIRLLGRTLDDLERLRIMHGNRVAAALRDGHDVPWVEAIEGNLRAVEHEAELELKRAWRKHPLAKWAKDIPGAGEILMGRLIAEIGDPGERPNPAKLLAYCGHGDPARGGAVPKGATQQELFKRGNPNAKKAVWKLAYQFMRTVGHDAATTTESTESIDRPSSRRSPYRDVYEERKATTEGKLHERACSRCGPAGKPAAVGSPWSDAHRHADALRIVGKRFLIDLWAADRARAGHTRYETQSSDARVGHPSRDAHSANARAGQGADDDQGHRARAGAPPA